MYDHLEWLRCTLFTRVGQMPSRVLFLGSRLERGCIHRTGHGPLRPGSEAPQHASSRHDVGALFDPLKNRRRVFRCEASYVTFAFPRLRNLNLAHVD